MRRFWYQVYCQQMDRLKDLADHERGELADPLDAGSRIALAVDGASGSIVGTLMNTLCAETSVGYYERLYGMDRPQVELGTASIATKYMVAPHLRKSNVGLRLARLSYLIGLEHGVRRSFMDCNPPLIGFFLKLGWRPHEGWIEHPAFGHVFSMALHLDDREYLEALNSPFLWTALDQG